MKTKMGNEWQVSHCLPSSGRIISTLWQGLTHTNFTKRLKNWGLTWGKVPKNMPLCELREGRQRGLGGKRHWNNVATSVPTG